MIPPKDGLRTLQRMLGLRKGVSGRKGGGDSSGTALVAIDFEYTGSLLTKFRACKNSQTGLAILLDPRGGIRHQGSEKKAISTHNFIAGSAKYFDKSSRRYIFGDSVPVKPDAPPINNQGQDPDGPGRRAARPRGRERAQGPAGAGVRVPGFRGRDAGYAGDGGVRVRGELEALAGRSAARAWVRGRGSAQRWQRRLLYAQGGSAHGCQGVGRAGVASRQGVVRNYVILPSCTYRERDERENMAKEGVEVGSGAWNLGLVRETLPRKMYPYLLCGPMERQCTGSVFCLAIL